MGGYNGLGIMVSLALLLAIGHCDVSCRATDGQAGEAGIPGRDGRPGTKGEKGEPALMVHGPVDASVLLRLKGDPGSRGNSGFTGPKGYSGAVGMKGLPGKLGSPGPDGSGINLGGNIPQQTPSAFSAIRNITSYPTINQRVTFQTAVVNINNNFQAASGYFTCRSPGLYYFSFHSMARVSMCLRIARDLTSEKLGFCDKSRGLDQVLSGGAVLELREGQKVWLESFRESTVQSDRDLQDSQPKLIIFNGFLIPK